MIFAYIDPGSGSMLLQVLLAGALAVPFFLRSSIAKVWQRVRGGTPRQHGIEPDAQDRPDS